MIKVYSIIIGIFFILNQLFPQFGSVKIDFDDRLLRSDERHDLINLKEDVKQFYFNTSWDKDFSDLDIAITYSIIFEGVASKGNVKTYMCKALIFKW